MKEKIKESDLASVIIKYLEDLGYTSYKEVSLKGAGGNIRTDCYLTKEDSNGNIVETLALETKTGFTLKVMEQAYRWRNYSNYCYVCIPTPKRKDRTTYQFCINICKLMNIGIFEVNMYSNTVKVLNAPTIAKNTKIPPLYEQQKESVAGNDTSSYITAFKITVMAIEEYMKDKEQEELSVMIKNIKHHYSTPSSASNTIQKMVNKKVIKNFTIIKEDKKIFIKKV